MSKDSHPTPRTGQWLALGLTLLDPTMCFAPLVKSYIFRATPVMMRPSGERRTGLIRWETRGVPLNADWLALTALGTDAFGLTTTVSTRIPPASAFAALTAKKRKNIRQERAQVARAGVTCTMRHADEIADADWAAIHRLYVGTRCQLRCIDHQGHALGNRKCNASRGL